MPPRAPWLAHYDAGVPRSLKPYPQRTLLDYVSETARDHPDARALLFKGAALSFSEMERRSARFAAALAVLGVKRGDRVGLLLPNCPQFFIAELGAWKLGAIVAPLNPIYTEHELEGPLREHGIETIVVLTRFYDRIKRLQPRTPLRRVIATNIKEHFPTHLRILFTLFRERRDGDRIKLAPGDYWLPELVRANQGTALPSTQVTADDPAVLLMSGGTTGTPKGVLGRHGALVEAGLQVQAWTSSVLGNEDSVILLPLPMFHVYGNVGVQSLAFL